MRSLMKPVLFLSACLIVAGVGIGCKKNVEDTTVVEGAANLPGASNVWVALDKQNYDGAMAALFKVRDACTTEEQGLQFLVLARQVRDKFSEAGVTNKAAAQAAMTLRAMTVGGR